MTDIAIVSAVYHAREYNDYNYILELFEQNFSGLMDDPAAHELLTALLRGKLKGKKKKQNWIKKRDEMLTAYYYACIELGATRYSSDDSDKINDKESALTAVTKNKEAALTAAAKTYYFFDKLTKAHEAREEETNSFYRRLSYHQIKNIVRGRGNTFSPPSRHSIDLALYNIITLEKNRIGFDEDKINFKIRTMREFEVYRLFNDY